MKDKGERMKGMEKGRIEFDDPAFRPLKQKPLTLEQKREQVRRGSPELVRYKNASASVEMNDRGEKREAAWPIITETIYYVECDFMDCDERLEVTEDEETLIQLAEAEGWVAEVGGAYCGLCKNRTPEGEPFPK